MEEEVDERQRAGSGVLVLQGAPLLVTSLPPSSSSSLMGAHLEGRQSGFGPSMDQYHLRY